MKRLQIPNYQLVIETDSYTGNFDRELVGYVFGILDGVQMEIDHAREFRKAFQDEEGLTENNSATFLDEFLFEVGQEVDDWEQMTFYTIGPYGPDCDNIYVFFDKLPSQEWAERIIRRIKAFFDHGYEDIEDKMWRDLFDEPWEGSIPQLLGVKMIDNNEQVIKKYDIN